jgi:DNA-binding MarR family transcriptional regulator
VTYELTDAGAEWLPQREEVTPPDNLDANARLVLEAAVDAEDVPVREISKKTGLSSSEVVPILNQLCEADHTQAYGVLLYRLKLTERGRELIDELQAQ